MAGATQLGNLGRVTLCQVLQRGQRVCKNSCSRSIARALAVLVPPAHFLFRDNTALARQIEAMLLRRFGPIRACAGCTGSAAARSTVNGLAPAVSCDMAAAPAAAGRTRTGRPDTAPAESDESR